MAENEALLARMDKPMVTQPLNPPDRIPPELDRWNWGAFFLTWIWGIGNGVFIALLALIPLVNIVMMFVLGARGSAWAWQKARWRDAEHFRKTQRIWAIVGAAIWLLFFAFAGAMVVAVPNIIKNTGAYQVTMETARSDPGVRDALGNDFEAGMWVSGSVETANDIGRAALSIPVTGSKGKGRVFSEASSRGGTWTLSLLYVVVEGGREPIVVVNTSGAIIPDAPLGI